MECAVRRCDMSIRFDGVCCVLSNRMRSGFAFASVALMVALPGPVIAAGPTFTQVCFSNDMAVTMAAGDFNRDGKLDVAINPGGSESFPSFAVNLLIDVYLGNGDGTFSGPTH